MTEGERGSGASERKDGWLRDLAERAVNLAEMRGAAYADVRIVEDRSESVQVKNGNVEALTSNEGQGIGVRVIVDGAWGFASSSQLSEAEVDRIVGRAVEIAKASALFKMGDVRLAPVEPARASYRTSYDEDPLSVPLSEKVDFLLRAEKALHVGSDVKVGLSSLQSWRENKFLLTSEGARIEQEITECGAGIEATAVSSEGEMQTRSFPNSFRGQYGTKGYELVRSLGLEESAPRIGEEAVALLSAPQCPSSTSDIILDGNQLALQVHESIGHPIELDRVLGTEASYAGTSFLGLKDVGSLRYGSPLVNVTADATLPGGLGTFGYDDEGIPAQRSFIIREGVFEGFLSSRETGVILGRPSNGTMRADGWNRIPLIRMTNINLEPGSWELEALLEDTGEGIFLSTNKSWSIDDKRLNFQFGTEIAWEITNGRLGRMLKNPTYTGITPEFWGSCDAICNEGHWQIWGTPNCGKGEPSQMMHVGHGAAPARFRGVTVGVGRW